MSEGKTNIKGTSSDSRVALKNLAGGREKRRDVDISGEGTLPSWLRGDSAGREEGPREG